MKVFTVLAAGGSGVRMNITTNKVLIPLLGQSVLLRSIRLFNHLIDGMILVCRHEDLYAMQAEADRADVSFPITLVSGGATRQASVFIGLHAIQECLQADPEDLVLIHDAARCLTPSLLIEKLINSCKTNGSCVPGIPAVNTIKICDKNGIVEKTPVRSSLYEIQTPQVFPFGLLFSAYQKADSDGFTATDDSSVMENYGFPVRVIPGSRYNIKITEKEDLLIARTMLKHKELPFCIGQGYDVHSLVEKRKLILCGVEIPHEKGLLGHSDADVALHALMDAMLGAAALGDIGKHFPDSSQEFSGISSILLLQKTNRIIHDSGYQLVNADITIVAQKPKISPYILLMRQKTADALHCDVSKISVKATTTEMLGFEGREEGISAQAVCLLRKEDFVE